MSLRFAKTCAAAALLGCLWSPAYSQDPAVSPGAASMSVADAVGTAVKMSKVIESAYLDRVVQRYDLKVAEDKFTPKPVLTAVGKKSVTKTDGLVTSEDRSGTLSGAISEYLPTGATLNAAGALAYDKHENGSVLHSNSWSVTLTQPLLKGGGIGVATASVRLARIQEQVNVLSLRAIIMDTVTSVIYAYRSLVQASRQLEIAGQSLARARELVAINRELISAGRMAEVEIVQAEADVASREFDLLSAENSLDSARLALIRLLDIDKRTRIAPSERIQDAEPAAPDYEAAKTAAFTNRPDYLSALLAVETSKISVMLAKNNKLWDFSLFGSYGGSDGSGQSASVRGWNAGASLIIPLRDLTLEQAYVSAATDLEKKNLSLGKLREDIEIAVQDAIRDVQMKVRQVGLARQSRVLSEKKLEVETEKMKAGRSTNFQLVAYQNDLVQAQNSELSAMIAYLNALAALDRTVGTTLETWHITIQERH